MKNKYLLIGVTLVLAAFPPIHSIFSERLIFQTNDDLGLMMMLNGTYFSQPTEHIIHIATPLAWIIKNLYIIQPSVSWYVILMFFTQFLAIASFAILIIQNSQDLNNFKKLLLYLLSLNLIVIFSIFYYSIQFTQTAIIAATAGGLIFLTSNKKYFKYFGGVLIVLGVLWRPEGGLLGIALLIFFYLTLNFKKKSLFNISFSNLISVLIIAGIAYASFLLTFSSWSPLIDQERRNFASLFDSRYALQHYETTNNSLKGIRQAARQQGLNKNDVDLFIDNYYYADTEVYSLQTLENIARNKNQEPLTDFVKGSFKKYNQILVNDFSNVGLVFLLYILFILIFFASNIVSNTLIFIVFYFANYLIFLQGRLPERVFLPVLFVTILMLLILNLRVTNQQITSPTREKIKVVFAAMLAFPILYFGYSYSLKNYEFIMNEQWWKQVEKKQILEFDLLLNYEPDKPIIVVPSFYGFLAKTVSPLATKEDMPPLWSHILPLGWVNRSPEYQAQIRHFNLNEDLLTSIANGDAFLATNVADDFTKIAKFLRKHHQVTIHWDPDPVFISGPGLGIWSVK